METSELRNKIFDTLNTVEDSSMLENVLNYIENFRKRKSSSSDLTKEQLNELDKRRERYISGKETSYSWQEVKQELIDKHGLQA